MDIGRICHLPNVINAHFDKENPMTFIKNRAVHLVAAAVATFFVWGVFGPQPSWVFGLGMTAFVV